MSDVVVAAELLNVARIPGPKGYGNQHIGKLVQDMISLEYICIFVFYQNNYPSCSHHYIFPIGKMVGHIKEYNERVRANHMKNMIDCNQQSSSRRGARPKLGVVLSQKFEYMCAKIHFMNRIKGLDCIQCVNA